MSFNKPEYAQIPKIIYITGGKGGTGRTLVAVDFATIFRNEEIKVLRIDGDVKNPNIHLLLGAKLENKKSVPFFKPKINEEKCIHCKKCIDEHFCEFNAMKWEDLRKIPTIDYSKIAC